MAFQNAFLRAECHAQPFFPMTSYGETHKWELLLVAVSLRFSRHDGDL